MESTGQLERYLAVEAGLLLWELDILTRTSECSGGRGPDGWHAHKTDPSVFRHSEVIEHPPLGRELLLWAWHGHVPCGSSGI